MDMEEIPEAPKSEPKILWLTKRKFLKFREGFEKLNERLRKPSRRLQLKSQNSRILIAIVLISILTIMGLRASTATTADGTILWSVINSTTSNNLSQPTCSSGSVAQTDAKDGTRLLVFKAASQSSDGSCTWTPPEGVKAVQLLVVGGGGGGGGAATNWSGTNISEGGGGGGGGGLFYTTNFLISGGTSVAITVGAGGTGGSGVNSVSASSANSGTNGNSSSFIESSNNQVTAQGGYGGKGAKAPSPESGTNDSGDGGPQGYVSGSALGTTFNSSTASTDTRVITGWTRSYTNPSGFGTCSSWSSISSFGGDNCYFFTGASHVGGSSHFEGAGGGGGAGTTCYGGTYSSQFAFHTSGGTAGQTANCNNGQDIGGAGGCGGFGMDGLAYAIADPAGTASIAYANGGGGGSGLEDAAPQTGGTCAEAKSAAGSFYSGTGAPGGKVSGASGTGGNASFAPVTNGGSDTTTATSGSADTGSGGGGGGRVAIKSNCVSGSTLISSCLPSMAGSNGAAGIVVVRFTALYAQNDTGAVTVQPSLYINSAVSAIDSSNIGTLVEQVATLTDDTTSPPTCGTFVNNTSYTSSPPFTSNASRGKCYRWTYNYQITNSASCPTSSGNSLTQCSSNQETSGSYINSTSPVVIVPLEAKLNLPQKILTDPRSISAAFPTLAAVTGTGYGPTKMQFCLYENSGSSISGNLGTVASSQALKFNASSSSDTTFTIGSSNWSLSATGLSQTTSGHTSLPSDLSLVSISNSNGQQFGASRYMLIQTLPQLPTFTSTCNPSTPLSPLAINPVNRDVSVIEIFPYDLSQTIRRAQINPPNHGR